MTVFGDGGDWAVVSWWAHDPRILAHRLLALSPIDVVISIPLTSTVEGDRIDSRGPIMALLQLPYRDAGENSPGGD